MKKNSRLEQVNKKKFYKNILIIIIGLGLLTVGLIALGPFILINMSLLLGQSDGEQSSKVINVKKYVAPPTINYLPSATNSSSLVVSGTGDKDQEIQVYLNGKMTKKTMTDKKKNFKISELLLKEGDNQIKVKAIDPNANESDFSQTVKILYEDKKPDLQIDSPKDGETIKGTNLVKIQGSTESGASVRVNEFLAIVSSDGKFEYTLNIGPGDAKIKIESTDEAGNKTNKEISVKIE